MWQVAPLVGAWVEIKEITLKALDKDVAPHAGAWVEIVDILNVIRNNAVAPPAERGLKCGLAWVACRWAGSLPLWERRLE